MITTLVTKQLSTCIRCLAFSSTLRYFAAPNNNSKKEEKMPKIPIDPSEYRLKKQKPSSCPTAKEAKKLAKTDPSKKIDQTKKPIGLYRADKKVEYEWTEPKPGDTGMNPDYDKVDVPNKANYVYTEYGYKLKGPEPTRYFDWERNGRVTDF